VNRQKFIRIRDIALPDRPFGGVKTSGSGLSVQDNRGRGMFRHSAGPVRPIPTSWNKHLRHLFPCLQRPARQLAGKEERTNK